MKAARPPHFWPTTPGPWGVAAIGRHWYVVHSESLRAKCIGRTNNRGTNYFDRAINEAARRNLEAQQQPKED